MNRHAAKYFAEQAKFIRRDLKNNSYGPGDVLQVIADTWRDDEDELKRAYEIESLAELRAGIMKSLPTKRGAAKKKASKKPAKKKAAKKTKRKSSWWPW